MSLLYLIGEPGVGKSSVMAALLAQEEADPGHRPWHYRRPLAHTLYPNAMHIGNPTPKNPAHPGTDTLSMSALPVACEWLPTLDPNMRIYAEGDRLAHPRLWSAMQAAGHNVQVVMLEGPAAERRAGRGTRQNETWLAGRATRVRNLAAEWPVIRIDTGTLTVSQVAGVVRAVSGGFRRREVS